MSGLADVDCVLRRNARSLSSSSSPRGMISDLLASPSSSYDDHGTGYGHSGGGYSSSHHECCPLVVDPKTLLTFLGLGAAATYLLQ